jgi:hypothetical protein
MSIRMDQPMASLVDMLAAKSWHQKSISLQVLVAALVLAVPLGS